MNVFVTGGAGYIGSICVEELLNAGHKVAVYDDLSEGHRAAVERPGRVGAESSQRWQIGCIDRRQRGGFHGGQAKG